MFSGLDRTMMTDYGELNLSCYLCLSIKIYCNKVKVIHFHIVYSCFYAKLNICDKERQYLFTVSLWEKLSIPALKQYE